MKRSLSLIFTLVYATTAQASFFDGPWNWVKSWFERPESAFFAREYKIEPKTTIFIKNIKGEIAIERAKKENILFVEAEKRAKADILPHTRIAVRTKDQTTYIETKIEEQNDGAEVFFTISVPDEITVIAEQKTGSISVKNVKGSLALQVAEAGNIYVENSTHSLSARALKGSIIATQPQLLEGAISLEAYRSIHLTLPSNIDAILTAQTAEGLVNCELDVTLKPITTQVTPEAFRNLRHHIEGALGKGGTATIMLDATKGPITIEKFENE